MQRLPRQRQRRDSSTSALHVVAAPVQDARGELLYVVAGCQDVRELQRLAMRDSLTGLANRAAITQIYARERMVSARVTRPFVVARADVLLYEAKSAGRNRVHVGNPPPG